jgi:hypothetical protein|tara:strand:- start:315 stop:443 length:129 start_codon:yes stop_codon:yes gene_type:complete
MPKEKTTILEQNKYKTLAKYAIDLKILYRFRNAKSKKEDKNG